MAFQFFKSLKKNIAENPNAWKFGFSTGTFLAKESMLVALYELGVKNLPVDYFTQIIQNNPNFIANIANITADFGPQQATELANFGLTCASLGASTAAQQVATAVIITYGVYCGVQYLNEIAHMSIDKIRTSYNADENQPLLVNQNPPAPNP